MGMIPVAGAPPPAAASAADLAHELVPGRRRVQRGDVGRAVQPAHGALGVALLAELEIMIADVAQRRRGLGREACQLFMHFVACRLPQVCAFCVKIGDANGASIRLFEGLGFREHKRMPVFEQVGGGGNEEVGPPIGHRQRPGARAALARPPRQRAAHLEAALAQIDARAAAKAGSRLEIFLV